MRLKELVLGPPIANPRSALGFPPRYRSQLRGPPQAPRQEVAGSQLQGIAVHVERGPYSAS